MLSPGRFIWLYLCSRAKGRDIWQVQCRLEKRKFCKCDLRFVFHAVVAMCITNPFTLMKVVGSPKRLCLSAKLHGVTLQHAEYNSDLKCRTSGGTKTYGELYQNLHISSSPFIFYSHKFSQETSVLSSELCGTWGQLITRIHFSALFFKLSYSNNVTYYICYKHIFNKSVIMFIIMYYKNL
jgi:hypothetical protein